MSDQAGSVAGETPEETIELPKPLRTASSTARAVGWLILTAAFTKFGALIAPWILLAVAPKAAGTLALMTYPFWCLAVAGALCLVRQRSVGFYLIYAYFAISLFGIGVPFLAGFSFFPLLERIAHLGPMQPLLHFGFNLLVIVVLAWSHYHLAPADSWLRKPSRVIAAGLVGAVIFAVGLWRQRFDYVNGPVSLPIELPVIGSVLGDFEVRGPLEVCSIEYPAINGLTTVFSGMADREQVTRLAAQLQLHLIDREEGWKKMLPLLKTWRLNELRFAGEFGPDALHYSGRVPGHRKLNIQLCWRPEDRRFCGQVFGMVARRSIQADNRPIRSTDR
jgi:hypothetical protein